MHAADRHSTKKCERHVRYYCVTKLQASAAAAAHAPGHGGRDGSPSVPAAARNALLSSSKHRLENWRCLPRD